MQNNLAGWSNLGAGAATGGHGPSLGTAMDYLIERVAPCPWSAAVGSNAPLHPSKVRGPGQLYTPEQRVRRDATRWTLVQGVLAPIQFLVFLVSLGLVLNYLSTGRGYEAATISIVVKTLTLYTIMITGCIWEKVVFDKYLFAESFFWEDVFSMLVLALHTAYLASQVGGFGSIEQRMFLALAAYASYAINATQFILKLRAARLQAPQAGAVA